MCLLAKYPVKQSLNKHNGHGQWTCVKTNMVTAQVLQMICSKLVW